MTVPVKAFLIHWDHGRSKYAWNYIGFASGTPQKNMVKGSSAYPYKSMRIKDEGSYVYFYMRSLLVMPEYRNISIEEIRLEDYQIDRKPKLKFHVSSNYNNVTNAPPLRKDNPCGQLTFGGGNNTNIFPGSMPFQSNTGMGTADSSFKNTASFGNTGINKLSGNTAPSLNLFGEASKRNSNMMGGLSTPVSNIFGDNSKPMSSMIGGTTTPSSNLFAANVAPTSNFLGGQSSQFSFGGNQNTGKESIFNPQNSYGNANFTGINSSNPQNSFLSGIQPSSSFNLGGTAKPSNINSGTGTSFSNFGVPSSSNLLGNIPSSNLLDGISPSNARAPSTSNFTGSVCAPSSLNLFGNNNQPLQNNLNSGSGFGTGNITSMANNQPNPSFSTNLNTQNTLQTNPTILPYGSTNNNSAPTFPQNSNNSLFNTNTNLFNTTANSNIGNNQSNIQGSNINTTGFMGIPNNTFNPINNNPVLSQTYQQTNYDPNNQSISQSMMDPYLIQNIKFEKLEKPQVSLKKTIPSFLNPQKNEFEFDMFDNDNNKTNEKREPLKLISKYNKNDLPVIKKELETSPPINEIKRMSKIKNLRIRIRKDYEIHYLEEIDSKNIKDVELKFTTIKPFVKTSDKKGCGLNKKARVVVRNFWPVSKKLGIVRKKKDCEVTMLENGIKERFVYELMNDDLRKFIEYDWERGIYVYEVDYFE